MNEDCEVAARSVTVSTEHTRKDPVTIWCKDLNIEESKPQPYCRLGLTHKVSRHDRLSMDLVVEINGGKVHSVLVLRTTRTISYYCRYMLYYQP